MRILQVHNYYQQAGGEDRVVACERALLQAHGHNVAAYTVHNDAVKQMPLIELGARTLWNQHTYRSVRQLIVKEQIQVVHIHNTLPLISPSVYWAADAERVPVVQTLHNYRLLCPASTFYRQGQVCELCLHKKIKTPAVMHRCYRNSAGTSAAVSGMLAVHTLLGSYHRKVNRHIALTEFAKAKFCDGGLPRDRITVKPNFLANDPGEGPGTGGYALFAGRLTEEKGLAAMLDAWSTAGLEIPLKIAGDGPMQMYVRERAAAIPNVEYLGACTHEKVIELLKQAAFLVFPSQWYEGMPLITIEAMACATPVVAFALGSMNDLIHDGVNGKKLSVEERGSLGSFLRQGITSLRELRTSTRHHFLQNYTAELNYAQLVGIYKRAQSECHSIS